MSDAIIQQKLAAMFAANKDEVSIPKIYIDMTGDHKAGAVLDELMFWTLPKRGSKTSLRVFRNGNLWLAVRRSDWWNRKRLTERQADGAIAKLLELDLIEKDVFLFDGKPTVHIRIKMDVFVKLYGDKITEYANEEGDETLIRDIADLYTMMGFPNETVNSNLPNGEMLNLPNGEMLNLPNGEIINNPIQPENTSPAKPAFDEELADIGWTIHAGKKVTKKQLYKQAETSKFEEGIEVELKRLRLNWVAFDEKAKETFRRFIRDLPKGQTLNQFITWWLQDEWRAANPPWTLAVIMQRWLQAFGKQTDETRPEYQPFPFQEN